MKIELFYSAMLPYTADELTQSIDGVVLNSLMNIDKLAKSRHEAPRWLDKKHVIRPAGSALGVQGVVFFAGLQLYM